MMSRKRLLSLCCAAIWIAVPQENTLIAMETSHVCSDLCGGGVACDTECWATQFDFDQDNPSTTCGSESFECCGNGQCDVGSEGCNVCTDDCGYVPGGCPQPECYSKNDCDYGEICNSRHECVPPTPTQYPPSPHPPCGGECTSNSQCCGTDICLPLNGSAYRYCGIPASTYCPDAPACNGYLYNTAYQNCDFNQYCMAGAKDTYCDPGIDRCMFVDGFECVTDDNFCKPL